MKVKIETHRFKTIVFINGRIHVSFPSKHYRGIQTYIDGERGCWIVEWHLKDTMIKCEYNSAKKWWSILKEIEKWLE